MRAYLFNVLLRRRWSHPSLEGIIHHVKRRLGRIERGSSSLRIGKHMIVFHAIDHGHGVLNVIKGHILNVHIVRTSIARLGSRMSGKVGNQSARCSTSDTMYMGSGTRCGCWATRPSRRPIQQTGAIKGMDKLRAKQWMSRMKRTVEAWAALPVSPPHFLHADAVP